MADREYLLRALELAGESTEPVKCACIIVQNGEIIAAEFNSQHADEVAVHHAEVKAVYQANRKTGKRILLNSTAYCSCEPCSMCLTALSLARVDRIVYRYSMKEMSAQDDPMAQLDSNEFARKYLKYVPKIEQLLL